MEVISLSGGAGALSLTSQAIGVAISQAEPANDALAVNTLGGADLVSASGLAGSSVLLTLNGGGGDDVLVGSQGNDTINGENGNDHMDGGPGIDTIDGGAGTDTAVNGESVTNVP